MHVYIFTDLSCSSTCFMYLQACQGSQFDSGVSMDMTDAKGESRDQIQVHKIPSEADFLIAYSAVPGKST